MNTCTFASHIDPQNDFARGRREKLLASALTSRAHKTILIELLPVLEPIN